jgi:P-type Cu+ transporter
MLSKNNDHVGENGGQKQAIMTIKGMMCSSCVSRAEAAVKGLDGVIMATVTLSNGKASVTYDPSKVSIEDMATAVKGVGYDVEAESVTLPVAGMMCASCVKRVENAILGTGGIFSASASMAPGQVTVKYSPAQANPGDIKRAIETAGYKVP